MGKTKEMLLEAIKEGAEAIVFIKGENGTSYSIPASLVNNYQEKMSKNSTKIENS